IPLCCGWRATVKSESPRTCHARAASKCPRTTSSLVSQRVPLTEVDDCGQTWKSAELDNPQRELGRAKGLLMARSARSGQPNEESVLSGLDSAATTGFYWYLALLACVGGFLFGYDTAVIGSVLEFIPYHLGSFATGYLVAGASLGAAVGALGAGPLTDRYGRKSLLMADAAVYALGAILSAVTINAGMLLSARTLIGVAVGADSAIATAYIAEFAPAGRRKLCDVRGGNRGICSNRNADEGAGAQEHAGIDGHRRQDRSQREDGRIGHQQGLPPVAVSQRPSPQAVSYTHLTLPTNREG